MSRRTLRHGTLAAALGACLMAGAWPGTADEVRHGTLSIAEPWSRATPTAARVGAGYLTITNEGAESDRLLAGDAPFAGRVEIHEMAVIDDVMRMREIAGGIELAPGATVVLEPGGLHVMFMQLLEPLVEGEVVRATLVFERAGAVELDFAVRSMGAGGHRHAH